MATYPSAEHPVILTDKMRREIAGAVAEIDLAQIAYLRKLTPTERTRIAADLIDSVERVGAFRLRQREPHLSEAEAYRIIRGGLLNYYRQQGREPLEPPAKSTGTTSTTGSNTSG